jgi:hypothetical protein
LALKLDDSANSGGTGFAVEENITSNLSPKYFLEVPRACGAQDDTQAILGIEHAGSIRHGTLCTTAPN